MASFGVNPVSPEASKSWLLRKTCPSWAGSKSTSHNHCDEVLAGAAAIGRQDPLHALGDVERRQGGTGNIADVAADLEGTAARLADELREPAGLAHLATIRFAVLQDIDAHHASARV